MAGIIINLKKGVKKNDFRGNQAGKEDDIVVVTLNNHPFNPLNSQVFRLRQSPGRSEADTSIKSVIITGMVKKPAAGADVNEVASNTPFQQHEFLKLVYLLSINWRIWKNPDRCCKWSCPWRRM